MHFSNAAYTLHDRAGTLASYIDKVHGLYIHYSPDHFLLFLYLL